MGSLLQNAEATAKFDWSRIVAEPGSMGLALARDILGDGFTNVIDVGARAAGAEKQWWRLGALAGYFGFEPDATECARLNSSRPAGTARETYFPVALGQRRSDATLYLTSDPACASLYQPDDSVISRYPALSVAKQTGETKVTMISLDEWWRENSCPDVSFIKLDTQGSELDILRGGLDVMKGCVGCELEVEFSPIYKKQPLFNEVDAFMRANGFVLWRLYGLCNYTEGPSTAPDSGRLFWANAIYFRDRSEYFYKQNRLKLLALLALLEACGDYDGVGAVLKALVAEQIIPAYSLQVFDSFVTRRIPNAEPTNEQLLEGRLKSAMKKADKYDKFRGSVVGRILGRFV